MRVIMSKRGGKMQHPEDSIKISKTLAAVLLTAMLSVAGSAVKAYVDVQVLKDDVNEYKSDINQIKKDIRALLIHNGINPDTIK